MASSPSAFSSPEELSKKGYYVSEAHENGLLDRSKIFLSFGGPGLDILKSACTILAEATSKRLADEQSHPDGCSLLQYGSLKGDPLFLIQLAQFLSERYGDPVDGLNLMVTAGATVGIYLTASIFFNEGDLVFMEDPTFFIANQMFLEMKRKCVPVTLDKDGIQVDQLERTLEEHWSKANFKPSNEKPFWAMLYIIPHFQNPSGVCLSEERCKYVIKLARKYHILVLCDDVYNLIHWCPSSHPPKRLFAYDSVDDPDYSGNVLSNGSFSKIFSPGIRVGWIEGPPKILKRLHNSSYVMSGGSLNHLTSGIIGKAIQLDLLGHHLDNTCRLLKEKNKLVADTLTKELQGIVKFHTPQGGFYFWVELPEKINAVKLVEYCKSKYGVEFHAGYKFSATPGSFPNFIRIAICYYGLEDISKGLRALCDSVKAFME